MNEKMGTSIKMLLLLLIIQTGRITLAQVECFTDGNCNGAPTITSTRRECCVGNPDAVAFRTEGDEYCNICIVFGFFQDTLSAPEQGAGYSVQAGYLKGANEAQQNLAFKIRNEHGTATRSDFTLRTQNIQVLFRNTEPEEVSFTFCVDAVAQEPPETAVLRLESRYPSVFERFDFDNNAFFLDQLSLTIIDSDRVQIFFTNNDYRVSEPDLFVPVRVAKYSRIATPVTVEVIPLTLTQFRDTSGRPDPPSGVAVDDPLSPIEAILADFNNSVITVTFPPDEDLPHVNDLPAFVPIVDDKIDEAYEQDFIVTLRIVSATNLASIDIAEGQDAICRIIDDDDIRIGFVQSMYTFQEPSNVEQELFVYDEVLLAKEDNVKSEQTFRVIVTTSTTTPNTNIQPASISAFVDEMTRDNDYIIYTPGQQFSVIEFLPDQQEISFNFLIFPDDVAEGTEAFQASPASQENTPTFLEPQTLYRNTFIVIEDDDSVVVGFERNYTVNETVGTVEVCAVVTNPPPEEDLPFSIVLSVNTVVGTAGEQDYSPLSAVNLDVALIFKRANWRDCFDVTINDDDVFENTETFTIDLVFDVFSPVPSAVILDPNVTSITILDDDAVVVGFEREQYTVSESDGSVEVCAVVTSRRPLPFPVILSLNTVPGTAGERDYVKVAAVDFNVALFFNSAIRRACVDIAIIDDNINEGPETFTVHLVFHPFYRIVSDVLLTPNVTAITIEAGV